MKKCLDCGAGIGIRAVRCAPCKAARKKLTRNAYAAAERELYKGVKKAGIGNNPRKCSTDGCKAIIHGHAARVLCDACKMEKRLAANRRDRSLDPGAQKARPRKKQLTDAEIDRRAMIITAENRRIELEMAARAARLPSHLIAARVMRDVCVSVLY